jgi:LPXTG-site transpeptidase (sortase) family protein
VAAGVLLAMTMTGLIDTGLSAGPGDSTPFGPTPNLTPEATPTAPLPTPDGAAIAQLVIPKYGIAAPVQTKGVDANNIMESPDGPTNVAWYDFSGKPGFGSNAVFSGHVDYINYGPAVFWHIKDLVAGDTIEVHLEDATVYTYSVESLQFVPADPTQDQLREIVGPSTNDVITLITCGGTFSQETHQYDHRTVVRARRVLDPPAAPVGTPSP